MNFMPDVRHDTAQTCLKHDLECDVQAIIHALLYLMETNSSTTIFFCLITSYKPLTSHSVIFLNHLHSAIVLFLVKSATKNISSPNLPLLVHSTVLIQEQKLGVAVMRNEYHLYLAFPQNTQTNLFINMLSSKFSSIE